MKLTYRSLLYVAVLSAALYSCDNEPVDYGQTIDEIEVGSPDLTDTDGDGLSDVAENKLLGQDTDGDGIPDYLDEDDDNDNVLTIDELADPNGNGVPEDALDTDGDGIPNYLDVDDDGDGILTINEGPLTLQDSDEDGVLDYLDDDDDGDGVPTLVENGAEGQNSDSDGIPDYLDTDDDNDGVLTMYEGYSQLLDTDEDGVLNYLDPDDDGDGKTTEFEESDPNGDGNPDDAVDSDGDGIPDYLDEYNYDLSACDSGDEENPQPIDNFAYFDLTAYTDVVTNGDETIDVSYHASENGAYFNNDFVSSPYQNETQLEDILYIRIEDAETGSLIKIEELYLFVVSCD